MIEIDPAPLVAKLLFPSSKVVLLSAANTTLRQERVGRCTQKAAFEVIDGGFPDKRTCYVIPKDSSVG